MNTRVKNTVMLAVPVLLVTAAWLYAGPLNPPAGPVASTGKTLVEVEPRIAINATNTPGDNDGSPSLFKITQPGSYYLTGNITGVVGKHGIEITASGVTIDLNGFDLAGVPGMGSFDGVRCTTTNLTDICVRNGSIRGWGASGIGLVTLNPFNTRIADVRVSANAGFGITAGFGSIVTTCSAHNNEGGGIIVSVGSTISGCSAYDNGAIGITTSSGSTVTGCSVYLNVDDGISAGPGCTITSCTVYDNGDDGILTSNGTTITACTVRLNEGDGIQVSSGCAVLANTCTSNGDGAGDGAGIHVTSGDNRIEGNVCNSSDRGIDVDTSGNLIIKNTCSANTVNWVIVAGNHYGPIIDRTAVAAPAAVNGNSAPEALGSTHPNANFTY